MCIMKRSGPIDCKSYLPCPINLESENVSISFFLPYHCVGMCVLIYFKFVL